MLSGDAAGEAQLATGAMGNKLVATAHLDFRIIIPPVLGLTMNSANQVEVSSNGRNVTLQTASGRVLLTAARRSVILQSTGCGTSTSGRTICTVTMP